MTTFSKLIVAAMIFSIGAVVGLITYQYGQQRVQVSVPPAIQLTADQMAHYFDQVPPTGAPVDAKIFCTTALTPPICLKNQGTE